MSAERLRYLVVDDPLRDAFDDRRLPDSGLAQKRRVVLRAAGEDLDRLVDLVGPADHRVELPLARLGRQVTAELVQLGCLRGLFRDAALDAADDGPAELRVGDAEALEQLPGLRVRVPRQCQQHMLGADIGRTELARLLVRSEEGSLRVWRERRGDIGAVALLGLLLQLRRDRLRVGIDLLEHVPHDVVLERRVQEVLAVEV